MSDAQEHSHAAWQQLAYEWGRAQEAWHDSTTDYFATHFWEPLQSETRSYQRALESLSDTLRAAREATRG